jgi:hypothetical protein
VGFGGTRHPAPGTRGVFSSSGAGRSWSLMAARRASSRLGTTEFDDNSVRRLRSPRPSSYDVHSNRMRKPWRSRQRHRARDVRLDHLRQTNGIRHGTLVVESTTNVAPRLPEPAANLSGREIARMNIVVGVAMIDRPKKTGKLCRCNSLRSYRFRVIGRVHVGRS